MLPDPQPCFAELPDPRRATKNKLHPLQDILMIVFCSVLSGVEYWVGMETFAREKETKPLHVAQGRFRPDQTWHGGGSASCPASSRDSQASASSSVRCRPVAR